MECLLIDTKEHIAREKYVLEVISEKNLGYVNDVLLENFYLIKTITHEDIITAGCFNPNRGILKLLSRYYSLFDVAKIMMGSHYPSEFKNEVLKQLRHYTPINSNNSHIGSLLEGLIKSRDTKSIIKLANLNESRKSEVILKTSTLELAIKLRYYNILELLLKSFPKWIDDVDIFKYCINTKRNFALNILVESGRFSDNFPIIFWLLNKIFIGKTRKLILYKDSLKMMLGNQEEIFRVAKEAIRIDRLDLFRFIRPYIKDRDRLFDILCFCMEIWNEDLVTELVNSGIDIEYNNGEIINYISQKYYYDGILLLAKLGYKP